MLLFQFINEESENEIDKAQRLNDFLEISSKVLLLSYVIISLVQMTSFTQLLLNNVTKYIHSKLKFLLYPLKKVLLKSPFLTRCQCLIPVILTAWEAEIRTIAVQGQPRQIVHETPFPK
jgi:hypothetical protein